MILKPDFIYECVYDINYELLYQENIKLLIFDLDSTIMTSKSGCYTDKTLDLLNKINQKFKICVMSNNKSEDYIKKVQNISFFEVYGNANKPSPKFIKEYLENNNIKKSEAVIIGDRPLTDILVGKLLGIRTILVDSINKKNENKIVRIVRWLERLTICK